MTRIYLGNTPFSITEDQIRAFFDGFMVSNIKIVNDRATGKPRGFAFVDIDADAQAAISALDGKELGGRTIKVSEAIEKQRSMPRDRRNDSQYAD